MLEGVNAGSSLIDLAAAALARGHQAGIDPAITTAKFHAASSILTATTC